VIYQEERPPMEDSVAVLKAGPLVKQPLERDIGPLMERFV
jgi:hypothetical protein